MFGCSSLCVMRRRLLIIKSLSFIATRRFQCHLEVSESDSFRGQQHCINHSAHLRGVLPDHRGWLRCLSIFIKKHRWRSRVDVLCRQLELARFCVIITCLLLINQCLDLICTHSDLCMLLLLLLLFLLTLLSYFLNFSQLSKILLTCINPWRLSSLIWFLSSYIRLVSF